MIKVTIFGGHEGRLNFDTQFYFTMFGNCEVVRPTLARQLVALRQAERDAAPPADETFDYSDGRMRFRYRRPLSGRPFFFTMFGATEIKSPTLAEEFVDLREAMDSKTLSTEDCERLIASVGLSEGSIGSFTLFAAFEEGAPPAEDKEVDSLAVQRHLGNVSEQAGRVLQLGIGQSEGERRAVLRQAITADV
ncbi:MAG: hypothetical protein ACYTFA_06880 [Planctomycetota bacterium]|jgi:hypothetical protein